VRLRRGHRALASGGGIGPVGGLTDGDSRQTRGEPLAPPGSRPPLGASLRCGEVLPWLSKTGSRASAIRPTPGPVRREQPSHPTKPLGAGAAGPTGASARDAAARRAAKRGHGGCLTRVP